MQNPDGGVAEQRTDLRVAFFGGSFDPPHCGHVAVARAAREAFGLDTVLFAPVGAQPLKPDGSAACFEDRLAMTRLAIAGEAGFAISLVDAPKAQAEGDPAPNYTIETLERLRADFGPGCALYCLMGADSFFALRRWHRAAELPFVAPLIVASRPGQPLKGLQEALPAGLTMQQAPTSDRVESGVAVRGYFLVNASGARTPFYLLPGLDVEISATEIREGISRGAGGQMIGTLAGPEKKPVVPAAVAEYIRSHGLYR